MFLRGPRDGASRRSDFVGCSLDGRVRVGILTTMIKRVPRVSHARSFRIGIIAVVVSVVLIFFAILVFFFFREAIFGA